MNSFGKIRYVLTILFLFITINQYLYTDDTSIAILPMKYTQDSKHLKAMSTAIPDIISLNLKFIEGYNVKSINETDFNTKNLQKICDSNKIELLIYGHEENTESGGISFTLSVFDAKTSTIIVEKTEEVEGILDVFSATDKLTLSILETLADSKITFGSLQLQFYGNKKDYNLYIDKKLIGKNVVHLEKIITGKKDIKIEFQKNSEKLSILEKEIVIVEGEKKTLFFPYPLSNNKKLSIFNTLDEKVCENIFLNNDFETTIQLLNTAQQEVTTIKDIHAQEYFAHKYRDWLIKWVKQNSLQKINTGFIQVDGLTDDWKGIERHSKEKPYAEYMLTPDGYIDFVKIGTDIHKENIYFLIKTSGKKVNPKHKIKIYMDLGSYDSPRSFDTLLVLQAPQNNKIKASFTVYQIDQNEQYIKKALTKSKKQIAVKNNIIEAKINLDSLGSNGLKSIYHYEIEDTTVDFIERNNYFPIDKSIEVNENPSKTEYRVPQILPWEEHFTSSNNDLYRLTINNSRTLPEVDSDWFTLDGRANEWAHLPRNMFDGVVRINDPSARITGLSMAQDDKYIYILLELKGRPSKKYGYQLQIYDILDETYQDIGATLVNIHYESGRWQTRITEDWWNDHNKNVTISNSHFNCGVNEVIEARFQKKVLKKEDKVRADFVIHHTQGSFLRPKVNRFLINLE